MSNNDRHVSSQHAGEVSDDTTTIFKFVSDLESQPGPSNQPSNTATNADHLTPLSSSSEVLPVSFVSDDGNTIDLEMSTTEKQTPIYEVLEQSLNPPSSPICDTNTTSVTSNDTVDDAETDRSNSVFNDTLPIGRELIDQIGRRT